MAEILVEEIVPGMVMEYRNVNYMNCSQYKAYRPYVPEFLHNRPRKLVKQLQEHDHEYSQLRHEHQLSPARFEVLSEDNDSLVS